MNETKQHRVFYKIDGTLIYVTIDQQLFLDILGGKNYHSEFKDWIMLKTPNNTFIYWRNNIVDSDTLILDLAISGMAYVANSDRLCNPFPFHPLKLN